ncbi:hypothetical protein AMTRI_Chr03g47750 [Amborella trichopoda]
MGCLSSAHLSVLINGSPKGFFKATRGIKHQDPLSPFLFTLLAKGFSMMLKNVERKERFSVFRVSPNSPIMSHLQYANDTLIFCDADIVQVKNLSFFIRCCEIALGLKVNMVEVACNRDF